MKSHITKLFAGAAMVAMLGLGSCVNDLDQMPNDPNVLTTGSFKENPKEYIGSVMGKCYSSLAFSGQSGPDGSCDISGLDGGTSQWSRIIFMLNEFPTDEVCWIWPDIGVFDLCTATFGTSNSNIYACYSRLYTHIAVCNDFLRLVSGDNLSNYEIEVDASLQSEIDQFCLEARALRDLSYFYVIDVFGNAVLAWDDMPYGEVPQQLTRKELFEKVVADLEDVLAKFPDGKPIYGRIGKDAVEALLCRYYLNAEVFTGTPAYDKCWNHAQNIIARHQGGGFQGSGLANDYLALFCGNNDMFMPGGSLADQNEILWGVPYQFPYAEAYGGTMFITSAATSANSQPIAIYGVSNDWTCMHARQQFSEKFNFVEGTSNDARTYLWTTENQGFTIKNDEFSTFTSGYASIKFTNTHANADGTIDKHQYADPNSGYTFNWVGKGEVNGLPQNTNKYPDTDLPILRLADVYLMAAECALRGAGNTADGLRYANYVRQRAGVSAWNSAEFNLNNMIDERARELYWENIRRTDLIRFGKFTGANYVWNWKNNIPDGGAIPAHLNLYPIPSDVIASYSTEYKQNPGY